jgi:two-component system sensor histidine kinase and response regulator WspE
MSGHRTAQISLAELFRTEVETEGKVLTDALLALERQGAAADVEQLMRAAHSIKGAARVVSMDHAVRVAHALEDFFVSAQHRGAHIESGNVDVLLRAVDLLSRFANGSADEQEAQAMLDDLAGLRETRKAPKTVAEEPVTAVVDVRTAMLPIFRSELATHGNAIRAELASPQPRADVLRNAFDAIAGSARLLRIAPLAAFAAASAKGEIPPDAQAVDAILTLSQTEDETFDAQLDHLLAQLPNVGRASARPATPEPIPPRPKTVERPKPARREVRITSDKLDRLMAATGETTVAARWFDGFTRAMSRLKQQHDALLDAIEDPQLRQLASECRAAIAERFEESVTFSRQLENISGRLYREVIATRMRAFSVGVHPFPRLVRDVARQLGKQVELQINGGSTEVDRDILEKLEAPLTHLIRNAIDHGLEPPRERVDAGKPSEGRIHLEASHQAGMLHVIVRDDGRGIDIERVRARVAERGLAGPEIVSRLSESELLEFLFLPGFTTAKSVTEISGRGVGLDAVQTMVQEVGGVVRVATAPGRGTTFTLQLPITRSVVRALLVEIDGEPYAVPLTRIEHALVATRREIHVAESREYVRFDGNNVGIVPARQILGIDLAPPAESVSILIISNQRSRYGVVVDRFTGESDLVLRPLDPRLGKVPNVSAVSVMLDGTPILLLDVDDLVASVGEILNEGRLQRVAGERATIERKLPIRRKRVLVVDDSLTVREVERRLLENHGYEVEVAVDGMHGWNAVRTSHFDLVISDVDMPRMTGIELVTRIKADERLARIPVMIVSYKDREEDRMRGLDAGANYYLTKGSFADDTMLRAVADLIGPGSP